MESSSMKSPSPTQALRRTTSRRIAAICPPPNEVAEIRPNTAAIAKSEGRGLSRSSPLTRAPSGAALFRERTASPIDAQPPAALLHQQMLRDELLDAAQPFSRLGERVEPKPFRP